MSRAADRLNAFIDALLRDRRPKRFPADSEEGAAMHAAAALRSARPGADLPSSQFVEELERRLGREMKRPSARLDGGGWTRRRLLQAAGASAAAAVAAGVAVERLGAGIGDRSPQDRATGQDTLDIANGQWMPVVAAAAVAPGHAVRFSASAVEGFVVNRDGRLEALSAVCTHMGCILYFNQGSRKLDCPCHGASFDLSGSPLNREYLKALTRLQSRVRDGMVEVQVARA